jgi:hypothetical protein
VNLLILIHFNNYHNLFNSSLSSAGVKINIQDYYGDTALHHALKVQVQRLFSFTFGVDDNSYDCVFILLLHGADGNIQNSDKDSAFDLMSNECYDLMKFILEHRNLFCEIPSLISMLEWGRTEISNLLSLPSSEQEIFYNLICNFHKEREEVAEEEEMRGACPFLDPSKTKCRRRKPIPTKYVRAPITPYITQEGQGQCPMGFKADTDSSQKCPFGFGSENSTAPNQLEAISDYSKSKCPFGFGSKEPQEGLSKCPFNFGESQNLPNQPEAISEPSKSKCPFGFGSNESQENHSFIEGNYPRDFNNINEPVHQIQNTTDCSTHDNLETKCPFTRAMRVLRPLFFGSVFLLGILNLK